MVAQVLRGSWRLYVARFRSFLIASAIVFVPLDIAIEATSGGASTALVLMSFAAYALVTGVIIVLARDPRADIANAYRLAAARFWTLLGVTFLSTLAIVVGLVLLIVPGLFLAARLAVVYQLVIIDRASVDDSLNRSWALVRGRTWPVLGLVTLVVAIEAVPVVVALTGDVTTRMLATVLSDTVLLPLAMTILTITYEHLVKTERTWT